MEPFKFYWDRLNLLAGVQFLIVMLLLYILSNYIEFTWYLVGTSLVLAWCIIILGKPIGKDKVLVVLLYLVIGLGITWLNNVLFDTYWPWLISVFIVTFLGTFLLKYGLQWYLLGWCLILWYYLMPVLGQIGNPQELMLSHGIGSAAVLILVILSVLWQNTKIKKTESTITNTEEVEVEPMKMWWIIAYSSIVASVMVFGLIIGEKYLSDPTMISNAAFMILGYTGSVVIWKAGIERMIGSTLAVVVGFYLGVYLQSEMIGILIMVFFYFLLLVFVEVNNGAVIFFFILTISYGWGLLDFETGNALANERFLSELGGVILAGVAIFLLNLLSKYLNHKKD